MSTPSDPSIPSTTALLQMRLLRLAGTLKTPTWVEMQVSSPCSCCFHLTRSHCLAVVLVYLRRRGAALRCAHRLVFAGCFECDEHVTCLLPAVLLGCRRRLLRVQLLHVQHAHKRSPVVRGRIRRNRRTVHSVRWLSQRAVQ